MAATLRAAAAAEKTVLAVESLSVDFRSGGGGMRVISDVSLRLKRGRFFALVGESGSGKSVTSLAIMGLLPSAARIAAGSVVLSTPDGDLDLASLGERRMRDVRGKLVSMIFQEPMSSLNPVIPIGEQIAEVLRRHMAASRGEARRQAVRLLDRVGIPMPERRVDSYPHELSGGMRQRVVIAIALACRPLALIADEPTTALDVTVQAQIIDLLREIQRETEMAVLFITHNFGVVAEIADEVGVMYSGQLVETGTTADVLRHPRHPYTRGLLDSLPPEIGACDGPPPILQAIPGTAASPAQKVTGCRFAPRCFRRVEQCTLAPIPLVPVDARSAVRCIRPLA